MRAFSSSHDNECYRHYSSSDLEADESALCIWMSEALGEASDELGLLLVQWC
jgi:hypothetical protein